MTVYVDRTPFSEKSDEVIFRDERVRIQDHQIIVWVSLSMYRELGPNLAAVPFPAILDTGHTHSFSIQERHLIEWAGLRPEAMRVIGVRRDRERDRHVMLRTANLWVHRNERGKRDQLVEGTAQLALSAQGIAVYSEGNFPRLPLLGLRVIAENSLILKVDGDRRETTLRTPRRWWPFS